ncbi:glycosyltransferase family 2 protein [Candidatus Gracilibacteria bacterium]|nr:glycosyltransferase family 2 protein [Candidatus Gracilibacteria bacterium]
MQAQTLDDWELLIVDDASPDNTTTVVAGLLNDVRISYVRLAQNCGHGGDQRGAAPRARAVYRLFAVGRCVSAGAPGYASGHARSRCWRSVGLFWHTIPLQSL